MTFLEVVSSQLPLRWGLREVKVSVENVLGEDEVAKVIIQIA